MSLRYALLGLLSINPMSGYELKKVIDESVRHFWYADQSQIYRTLAALVDEDLAERRTVVQDDRPNRHVHELTAQGRAELDAWLVSPVVEAPTREPFLLRLFFAGRLEVDEVRGLLDDRRARARDQLATLQAIDVASEQDDLSTRLRRATLEYGLTHARAEIAWLDGVREMIDEAPEAR